MKSKSRRYELLLPVRFNDGSDVPEHLLGRAVNENVERFGAVTIYKHAAEGHWRHEETIETNLPSSSSTYRTLQKTGNGSNPTKRNEKRN